MQKMPMPDSQRYPIETFYLINIVEDIVGFYVKKRFILIVL